MTMPAPWPTANVDAHAPNPVRDAVLIWRSDRYTDVSWKHQVQQSLHPTLRTPHVPTTPATSPARSLPNIARNSTVLPTLVKSCGHGFHIKRTTHAAKTGPYSSLDTTTSGCSVSC